MNNLFCFLEMPNDIDPETIKEISRKTDLISGVVITIVLIALLAFVLYLVYMYKGMKRPKRSTNRFQNFKTASGRITDVETVSYFVKPYEETKQVVETPLKKETYSGRRFRDVEWAANMAMQTDIHNDALNKVRQNMNTPNKEVEKIRFKVRYEFSRENGDIYTGECFVYDKTDDIAVGKYIEVKYNPDHPLTNYTKYNNPVGFF